MIFGGDRRFLYCWKQIQWKNSKSRIQHGDVMNWNYFLALCRTQEYPTRKLWESHFSFCCFFLFRVVFLLWYCLSWLIKGKTFKLRLMNETEKPASGRQSPITLTVATQPSNSKESTSGSNQGRNSRQASPARFSTELILNTGWSQLSAVSIGEVA